MNWRVIIGWLGMMGVLLPVKAQWIACVDSNHLDPYQACTMEFDPVCGCDNTTYANECSAYWHGGINTIAYAGVCQNDLFEFVHYPNPVVSQMHFGIQLASQRELDGSMTISDMYGNVVYFKLLTHLTGDYPFLQTIPLYGLETGMYTLMVRVEQVIKVRKFVKFRI